MLLTAPVLGGFALAAGIVLGAVDKHLDEVCGIIEEKMRNQIEDAKKGICEKIENLKARLNDLVVCYECMREGLIKAGEGLWQIDNNIKTRIVQ